MAKTTRLTITTPEGVFYDDQVDIVTIRTSLGDLGLLANMEETIADLVISELHINHINTPKHRSVAIDSGIVYVKKDQITIVTSAAEFSENINIERARLAQDEAQKALNDLRRQGTIDSEQEARLKRSINRLKIASNKH
ncbi:ATP synthase F1 subunit epsilon [Mycoplasmopsis agassizii]|uniref:ATP synthase epsilon chain n=1 Tax=Mycoplasmopsis agassizii TaxID=33922 RepID=A0ABX4H5I9_9BACT|nr:ATP synthase F1 subunit epsilon [Mycoplasmopsis agassizii]PAF55048.1 ATP synthase F1 subunit epsilon [Mycoplasmopsis agassizii]SMC17411.1 ATP synthase F1 subcomplex epsilon subunit [Mycoplasmopsis agassizii]